MNPIVGVLALQGGFEEHHAKLKECKVSSLDVRLPKDLEKVDALIIPGGESTVIGKLMFEHHLDKAILSKARAGMPIWGTCAGAIILAKDIVSSKQPRLGLMDISVKRNEYGRQAESFETLLSVKGIGEFPGIFIRAPVISSVSSAVEVLSSFEGNPVLVRQGSMLASTFHPELTSSTLIHRYFLGMLKQRICL